MNDRGRAQGDGRASGSGGPVGVRTSRRAVLALPLAAAACGPFSGCGSGGAAGGAQVASPTPEPRELVVLAASSLTDAFGEMAESFPRGPGLNGTKVRLSFGASSQLRVQLEQGAPADVFESADAIQMEAAVRGGLMKGAPSVFARNRLVVIVPRENRAAIATLADLARPGLKVVSTAKEVPIGAYTLEALGKLGADAQYGAGYAARVLGNVVSEEANVRQIVTKVQLGEADAGFVYASDVTTRVAGDVRTIEIPERFQPAAEHLIGVTRGAKAPALAQRFVEYVLDPAGRSILQKHGFVPLR